jgi:Kef-type K+ transport system membrane component KefB
MNYSARGGSLPRFLESAGVRGAAATYLLVVGVPLAAAGLACYAGSRFFATGSLDVASRLSDLPAEPRPLIALLVALTTILLFSRVIGGLFVRIGQPRVLGEIVAGIVLGPSLLGAIAPDIAVRLIAPAVLGPLAAIGELGLILFMFLVGLEFDLGVLRRRGHVALLVSHTSICLPLLGGVVVGVVAYAMWFEGTVPFLPFVLFMGLAMSVTAFPVLTRILRDRNLHTTSLGSLAVACAAADDITAWCLLAALLGFAGSASGAGLTSIVGAAIYCAAMWGIVRPLFQRLANIGAAGLGALFLGLFSSALVAEWVGIHAFFGAFLFGLCVPRNAVLARELPEKLHEVTGSLLMPAFFVISGMRTEFGTLNEFDGWLLCLAVVFVAAAGKLLGTILPARIAGLGWNESVRLGILMNTRGLMEIVIANIALDCGIIPPQMFTVLVMMALVTTFATGPLLSLTERWHGNVDSIDRCIRNGSWKR